MLRIIFFLIQVAAFIALAVWLSDNPGQVKINWLNYQIDTHFSIFLIFIIFIVFMLWLFYALFNKIMKAPKTFFSLRKSRRKSAGYKALTLGMAAVAAGDKDEAVRLSKKANILLKDPLLTRLLSAQTATLNGDETAALNYFSALSEDHETEFVGLVGLMRQAMGNQDQRLLLELTKKAYKKRPESAFVCETLFSLQTKMADWENAQKTLTESVRRKVKTEKVAVGLRVTICTARAIEFKNNDMVLEAIKYADKALTDDKNFVPAAILRAELTQDPEKERKTIRTLEAIISATPHRELTMNYLKLWSEESPLQHFQRLQKLLIKSDKSVQGRLILAEIALEAELWGEARKYLGDILIDNMTNHGCRLMASLEQRERNDETEARRWLEKSINAAVDYRWTCNSCGATGEEWSPLCGNCDRFDLITWKVPPRVSALSDPASFKASDKQAQILEQ